MLGDERMIEPVALDHDLQYASEQRRIPPRLDGQVQIAGAGRGRDPRILNDDLRALFARLPDVVRGNRRAFGDVRARHPDDVRAHHVGPGVRRAVDAEGFLVRGAGTHHAQPAVVVDERRFQANPGEFAEQVRLFGRQAGAAQNTDRSDTVGVLKATDLGGDASDGLLVRQRAEAGR